MNNQKIIFFISMIFIITFTAGCCKPCVVQDDFELTLKWGYRNLWLAHMGLEYPHSKKMLESCWKGRDQSCLNAYLRVQQGKNLVLNKKETNPERTLSFTLDTIFTQCEKDREQIQDENAAIVAESECIGAIAALYFFNNEDEDQLILNRLNDASQKVIGMVLYGVHAEWNYNRSDPSRWIEFINQLSDETIEQMASPSGKMERSFITDKFKIKESEIEPFGLMLCD